MKRLSYLLCALTLLFSGCDEIDYADRFVDVGMTIPTTSKNVLIEDFTGQNCPNCPKAANEIASLQKLYGKSKVIAVAIHGGSMAYSEERYPDMGLGTPTGEEYNKHWNIKSWPAGIVNRKSGVTDFPQWHAWVQTGLHDEQPGADITVSTTYDETTRQAIVSTTVKMAKAGSAKLQLWVIENNIQTYQVEQTNYVHNHVLRAAINGDWGEEITADTNEQELNYTHEFTAKDKWNADNLAIVAFVYTNQDGVLQVVEKHLTNNK